MTMLTTGAMKMDLSTEKPQVVMIINSAVAVVIEWKNSTINNLNLVWTGCSFCSLEMTLDAIPSLGVMSDADFHHCNFQYSLESALFHIQLSR